MSSTFESCLVSGASGDSGDFYYTITTGAPAALVKLTAASATTFTKTTVATDGHLRLRRGRSPGWARTCS